jgi:hypothetical protein
MVPKEVSNFVKLRWSLKIHTFLIIFVIFFFNFIDFLLFSNENVKYDNHRKLTMGIRPPLLPELAFGLVSPEKKRENLCQTGCCKTLSSSCSYFMPNVQVDVSQVKICFQNVRRKAIFPKVFCTENKLESGNRQTFKEKTNLGDQVGKF